MPLVAFICVAYSNPFCKTNYCSNNSATGGIGSVEARFSKAPETFRVREAIFISSASKTEKCIRLKLLVLKGASVHIKN